MKDEEEEEVQATPLARWAGIVSPAGLTTITGKQRFAVTIKLAEKPPKLTSSFMKEMNAALKTKIDQTSGCKLTAAFLLVDSERVRLQRATARFSTFNEAQTCLRFLKELGLPVNEVSAELEDFGNRKYDPWVERISHAWWPWFAEWRNPAPEMPMAKVKNRLDVTEGSKYKEGASGKLGTSDEVDRADAQSNEGDNGGKKRKRNKTPEDEPQDEEKPRRKKKKRSSDEGEQSEP